MCNILLNIIVAITRLPLAEAIPKLRFGLRKRTISQIDADMRRKAEIGSIRALGTSNAELKALLYNQYVKDMGRPLCLNP